MSADVQPSSQHTVTGASATVAFLRAWLQLDAAGDYVLATSGSKDAAFVVDGSGDFAITTTVAPGGVEASAALLNGDYIIYQG